MEKNKIEEYVFIFNENTVTKSTFDFSDFNHLKKIGEIDGYVVDEIGIKIIRKRNKFFTQTNKN